jgi:hypothetical protein
MPAGAATREREKAAFAGTAIATFAREKDFFF